LGTVCGESSFFVKRTRYTLARLNPLTQPLPRLRTTATEIAIFLIDVSGASQDDERDDNEDSDCTYDGKRNQELFIVNLREEVDWTVGEHVASLSSSAQERNEWCSGNTRETA
jgi:hypothetical protein